LNTEKQYWFAQQHKCIANLLFVQISTDWIGLLIEGKVKYK